MRESERRAWLELALKQMGLTPGNLPWQWVKGDGSFSVLVDRGSGRKLATGPSKFSDLPARVVKHG